MLAPSEQWQSWPVASHMAAGSLRTWKGLWICLQVCLEVPGGAGSFGRGLWHDLIYIVEESGIVDGQDKQGRKAAVVWLQS